MRTTKPISTISYNTEAFLVERLNTLVKARKLEFWAFVPHLGEDDEAGKKSHIHVYAEPARMLQTVELQELFREYDPTCPDKPLGVQLFRNSKFDTWYLYGLHDRDYLASIGEERKYHYAAEDVRTSSKDDLFCKVKQIDFRKVTPYADMRRAMADGKTFIEYVEAAGVLPAMYHAYKEAWNDALYQRERQDVQRFNDEARNRVVTTQDAYGEAFKSSK